MRGLSTGILLCDDCGSGSDSVCAVKEYGRDLCNRCRITLGAKQIEDLRWALRTHCVEKVMSTKHCLECHGTWEVNDPEQHALGCLAKVPEKI